MAPTTHFVSLEDAVRTTLPQFGYQIHLASGEVEKVIVSREQIRQFLNGMYGGHGPNGEILFNPKKGVIPENLPNIGPSPLLTKGEMDYYVNEYTNHGLGSTLNWYRTRELNYQEELTLEKSIIDVPVLFVQALNDNVLTPDLARGMEQYFPKLTRGEVKAGHWALWQAPDQVNRMIREWLEHVAFGHAKSSL
ncbi:hypothetical protein MMC34_003284 [Xylographa carneopallida]|nr:hypothetical protein [Xylographa carneopallida]